MATRANIEAELVSRAEAWLTAASMAITTAGSNADLNGPIGYGIVVAGGTVSDRSLVTSTDVQTVASDDYDLMVAAAELRMLESVLANYALVDAKAGPVEAKSSQLADRIEKRIAWLRGWLSITYGIGGSATLTTGVLNLNFAE